MLTTGSSDWRYVHKRGHSELTVKERFAVGLPAAIFEICQELQWAAMRGEEKKA